MVSITTGVPLRSSVRRHLLPVSEEFSPEVVRALTEQQRLRVSAVSDWAHLTVPEDIFVVAHPMSFEVPIHAHEYFELCFVKDGTVMNKTDQRELYLTDGTLCIMNLTSRHALRPVKGDATVINLCLLPRLFDEGVFRELLDADTTLAGFLRGEGTHDCLIYPNTGNHALAHAMVGIVDTYAEEGHHYSVGLAARVLLLLDTLAKTPDYSFVGIDHQALLMLEYLREHCDDFRVKDLAAAFGYSTNYCSQYMKSHIGLTITQLLANARTEKAEELLAGTDLSIQAVAEAVGYTSVSHFNDLFRRGHGVTPGEYRLLKSLL